jgi:hypothetical protein
MMLLLLLAALVLQENVGNAEKAAGGHDVVGVVQPVLPARKSSDIINIGSTIKEKITAVNRYPSDLFLFPSLLLSLSRSLDGTYTIIYIYARKSYVANILMNSTGCWNQEHSKLGSKARIE